ncbi:MAG: helix-turn-helix domain-containing protein [Crocinitomix sp.]|nr:helix-turn-helix domain-containing protein [Crocinitomix sp.]
MTILPVLNIEQFDFENQQGHFYANEFATHLEKYHAAISKPHKHDFYLVVLFTKGQGVHEIDFNAYPIKPGSLFLLRPGQTHHWELSEDIDGYIFFHTREFYNLLFPNRNIDDYPVFNSNYNSPLIELETNQVDEYTEHFKQILEEYEQRFWLKDRRISLLVDLIYVDLARIYRAKHPTTSDDSMKRINRLLQLEKQIDLYYKTRKHAKDYAAALNVSVKHLNKNVILALGKTTSDLIHDRILLEAKRMLIHGNASIQEIAYDLGYEDASYFSRFFKKKTGISPSDFFQKYEAK